MGSEQQQQNYIYSPLQSVVSQPSYYTSQPSPHLQRKLGNCGLEMGSTLISGNFIGVVNHFFNLEYKFQDFNTVKI